MAIIRSFRELDVYALGREQAKRIFVIFAYGSDTTLIASG